jgi:23S rRNA pseudouridine2605 synthase
MPAERIQKVLANAGVASRRASEALVAAGRVRVDGRTATICQAVDPVGSVIEVDGIPVGVGVGRTYVALHKPAGVTSTTQDRHAATTVLDLVPTAFVPDGTRLYPVGRLDLDSEGLLLLTNDGEWAERVLHPRFGVQREYALALRAPLDPDQLKAIEAGITLEEGQARLAVPLRPASGVETNRLAQTLDPAPDADLIWYRAILTQGWKRQLRRMLAAVGAPIVRLARVRIGSVWLGDLPSGRARMLKEPEIRSLGEGQATPGRSATAKGRSNRRPASKDRPASSDRPGADARAAKPRAAQSGRTGPG